MPRKQMSKLSIFYLMQWLQGQDQAKLAKETIVEIKIRASKELQSKVEKITDCSIRSAMRDLGLICATTKINPESIGFGACINPIEVLNRVKKIEKFLAKYFAEEWASLN